tara:strand:+ start:175 stop:444 length:270 start_codon:yes stop_codon:yes gene_type:complete
MYPHTDIYPLLKTNKHIYIYISTLQPNQPNFTKIEIRVGIIQKVWNHDSADKLYCEEVDLGPELGIREIASGLRNNYTLDEMLGKRVCD